MDLRREENRERKQKIEVEKNRGKKRWKEGKEGRRISFDIG